MPGRLAVISIGLLAASVAPALAMRRGYGSKAGARFAAGSALATLAQQSLVGIAAARKNASLTAVDAMTLSRGVASAVLVGLLTSGVRRRNGLAGWLGWGSLVYGSIVCDWLDGPIARRLGATSELGALLDLESDSWLTLTSASSATTWGGLPALCMAAPLARYALLAAALATAAVLGFVLGQSSGPSSSSSASIDPVRVVKLAGTNLNRNARGTLELGKADGDGNWPMLLHATGLRPLPEGGYYDLYLTKGGKPVVLCGSFNVKDGEAIVRFSAAYDLSHFDRNGWVITRQLPSNHEPTQVVLKPTVA